MLLPCEVAVKCLLPVVRAMMAKQLVNEHGLKQAEAAKILGVSQPAISLYCRKIRGKAIDLEKDQDVKGLVRKMSDALAKKELAQKELVQTYCKICRTIRAKGLLCRLHKRFDTTIDLETCDLCKPTEPLTCI